MLGHLGINVSNLDQARRYWGVLMPVLGFDVFLDDVDQLAFRPGAGKPGTYVFMYVAADERAYSATAIGLQHLAFMVPTQQAVRDVYEVAVGLGSETVHDPRTFPQYPQPYFAAFWRDPDGVMIEAVCHHDR